MKKYLSIIYDGCITGEDIHQMTTSDLEDAGVDGYLDQVKIYVALLNLKKDKEFNNFYMVSSTLQFLRSQPDLKKYASSFRKFELNGDILLHSTVRVLKEVGVESVLDAIRILVHFRNTEMGYNHEESKKELISKVKSTEMPNKEIKWRRTISVL